MLKPNWLSSLPALTSLNLLGTHLDHISGRQLQGPLKLSHLQLVPLICWRATLLASSTAQLGVMGREFHSV